MKIALLAPFEESVPPEKYGGTELVVYNLAQLLVDFGHKVYLLATGDSKTKANLIPIFPEAIRKNPLAKDMKIRDALKYMGVSRVLDELNKIQPDVIHNHIGWRFMPFAHSFKSPTVTTLHGPLDIPYQQFVYGSFPDDNYVSISNSQRDPFTKLNYAATVYNGINLDGFDFYDKPGEYLAFLGRMSPEKGPKIAIEIAKLAGMKLKMAAKVDAVDKEYFEKEIKPLVDGKQIEFIGEIGPDQKSDFLGKAFALLAPIQWREPFGLFIVEAMATGTPVVVTNMGSASELVVDNKTGFVVNNNIPDFVEALNKIPTIDRKACRERVEKNFTQEIMAQNYIKVYEKLIHNNAKK